MHLFIDLLIKMKTLYTHNNAKYTRKNRFQNESIFLQRTLGVILDLVSKKELVASMKELFPLTYQCVFVVLFCLILPYYRVMFIMRAHFLMTWVMMNVYELMISVLSPL